MVGAFQQGAFQRGAFQMAEEERRARSASLRLGSLKKVRREKDAILGWSSENYRLAREFSIKKLLHERSEKEPEVKASDIAPEVLEEEIFDTLSRWRNEEEALLIALSMLL